MPGASSGPKLHKSRRCYLGGPTLQHRPQTPSTEKVHVKMEHLLTRVSPAVDDQTIPGLIDALGLGNPSRDGEESAERGFVHLRHVRHGWNGAIGNDEDVGGHEWRHVPECCDEVVLVQDVGSDLTADDLAENSVLHESSDDWTMVSQGRWDSTPHPRQVGCCIDLRYASPGGRASPTRPRFARCPLRWNSLTWLPPCLRRPAPFSVRSGYPPHSHHALKRGRWEDPEAVVHRPPADGLRRGVVTPRTSGMEGVAGRAGT